MFTYAFFMFGTCIIYKFSTNAGKIHVLYMSFSHIIE